MGRCRLKAISENVRPHHSHSSCSENCARSSLKIQSTYMDQLTTFQWNKTGRNAELHTHTLIKKLSHTHTHTCKHTHTHTPKDSNNQTTIHTDLWKKQKQKIHWWTLKIYQKTPSERESETEKQGQAGRDGHPDKQTDSQPDRDRQTNSTHRDTA